MHKLLTILTVFIVLSSLYDVNAQLLTEERSQYTKADTLRGMLSPLRDCYDVHYYNLELEVDPEDQFLSGSNEIYFEVVKPFAKMQIDLFEHMDIHAINFNNSKLSFERLHNAVFVSFPQLLELGERHKIEVMYSGKPIAAKRAPWDGGFDWKKDNNGDHWIGVACEGMGASSWWPNKDHLSDEPDSMTMRVTVPSNLICVMNGRLKNKQVIDGKAAYTWHVSNPINNYNVSVNIANYVHFADTFKSFEDGAILDLDYYVLPYNLEKAKEQFKQVKPMMKCFEKYFGKYPFYEDGFKLVETPYLGMEHQSAIAYGNEYLTGYKGRDYSRIGLDFDYIIIHESGHEWWGNSVGCADIADLWIHEGYCTYSEAVYVECLYDYETAQKYVNAKQNGLKNKEALIGDYNVNAEGSGEMYSKGMLFLNTLRHILQNDALWWESLREIAEKEFYHQTISTNDLIDYYHKKFGRDLTAIFQQYLNHPAIPQLNFKFEGSGPQKKLLLKWTTDVEQFKMPVYLTLDGRNYQWVEITNDWKTIIVGEKSNGKLKVDMNKTYIEFYGFES